MPRYHPNSVCPWCSTSTALWQQLGVQTPRKPMVLWNKWPWRHPRQTSDLPFDKCSWKPQLGAVDISRCVRQICPPRQGRGLSNWCRQYILHIWSSCGGYTASRTSTNSAIPSAVSSVIWAAIPPATSIRLCSAECSAPIQSSFRCLPLSVMLVLPNLAASSRLCKYCHICLLPVPRLTMGQQQKWELAVFCCTQYYCH